MNRKQVVSLLLLCVLVLSMTLSFSGAETMKRARSEVKLYDDSEDESSSSYMASSRKKSSKRNFDPRKMTPSEILNQFGLGKTVPFFTDMLDHWDGLYTTAVDHFDAVNDILEALRQSFLKMVEMVRSAPEPLPSTIDGEMIVQVVNVMEQHFHEQVQQNSRINMDRIEPFFKTYADAFFNSLSTGYQTMYGMGISLTWPIVYMIAPFVQRLPTELVDRDMFQGVFEVPGELKQVLYNVLADIMKSDYAHFVQMIAAFLSTVDFKRMMGDKVEL